MTKKKTTKAKKTDGGSKKAWSGRFAEDTAKVAEEFNASIHFDRRLYRQDILGSIGHAKVLKKAGILTARETEKIIKGLKSVESEIDSGRFNFTTAQEDIHMAIEGRLTEKIGGLGGKLHTGRSRNDQVALDIRLYMKEEVGNLIKLIKGLRKVLVGVAEKTTDCVMPGYTHLQRAQPVLFGHHMLAYYEMFGRDCDRLLDVYKRTDVLPLGSGALAGSPYPLDRKYAAKLLGFKSVSSNSLDGVSDRDFSLEFLSAASILMMHISRLSEEIILWSSQEFAFIELTDAFSTGSSIMPQKKNPDMAELGRGKTGRVYGNLIGLLTTMKSLPLAYNKDMQEDKEPLFDTVDTLKATLTVFAPMLKGMKVNKGPMYDATADGFLTATDAADYLTQKGVPFRRAHEASGRAVAYCIAESKRLEDLTLKEWKFFSPKFEDDILKAVDTLSSLNSRKVYGGTAPSEVKRQIRKAKRELAKG